MTYDDAPHYGEDDRREEPVVLRPAPPPPPPPFRPSLGRRILSAIFALVFIVSVIMNLVLMTMLGATLATAEGEGIKEARVSGSADQERKIAVIPIKGVIFEDDSPLARSVYTFAMAAAKKARQDDAVAAVIIEVNSPGGSVTASDQLYHAITQLSKAKPVVVLMKDIAASGGYYISAPAKTIMASPTTITGSIGVILSGMNLTGLMEKFGITMDVIKSGKRKDLLSPWRAMTEDEREMLNGIVTELHQKFLDAVMTGRGDRMSRERLAELADGSIFTAEQARQNRLIDAIGYREDAIKVAAGFANLGPDPLVVQYRRTSTLLGMLAGARASQGNTFGAEQFVRFITGSPFLYMWLMPQGR